MNALNAGNAGGSPPLPDESPFQPGAGTAPPAWGGRRKEREVLLSMLRSLASGQKPKAHPFLFGPRGSGKTVLLNWLAEVAARDDHGRPIEVVRLSRRGFASQTALAQALSARGREALTTTAAEGGLEARAGLPGLLGVKSGTLVRTTKQTEWRAPTTDEILQDRTLDAEAGARALLIILDELHEVPAQCVDAPGLDPLGDFLNAIQNADAVLLAMAGTPDAEDRLSQAGATFAGRMVKPHGWLPIARLDSEDAMQALFQPLAELGRRPLGAADGNCGGELAAAAYGACSGHPHFIQLLGDALFQAMRQSSPESPIIGSDIFARALETFHQWRDQHHAERYAELKRFGLLECAAEVGRLLRDGRRKAPAGLLSRELDECVRKGLKARKAGDYVSEEGAAWVRTHEDALRNLRHLGFVWGEAGGSTAKAFVPGIPCLADYALDRAVEDLPHVAKRMAAWRHPSDERKSKKALRQEIWDLNRS